MSSVFSILYISPKQRHTQLLEKMLKGEMDAHWGYERNSLKIYMQAKNWMRVELIKDSYRFERRVIRF